MKQFSIILFLILIYFTANAQWYQTKGPEGGSVNCIAKDSTNTFAGTDGDGIFISTNNGLSWQNANNGLPELRITSIAISGTNIFAGTVGGGVFLSTNNGANWSAVNTGLTSPNISDLLIIGTNLFAATYGGGVFLSSNNGATWTAVNNGFTSLNIKKLATNGTHIFASIPGLGVFTTSNNGVSWTSANTGLTNLTINNFALIGTNIYAGTEGGGVFLSTNNGLSWVPKNSGLGPGSLIYALASDGNNLVLSAPSTGGCLYLSSDSGNNWSSLPTMRFCGSIKLLYYSGNFLYACTTGKGIFISNNNGGSWVASNSGLVATFVTSLTANSTNFFATDVYSLYSSNDKGNNWSYIDLIFGNELSYVAASDSFVFVGGGGTGMFRSIDYGVTWNFIPFADIQSIVFNGTKIFVGGYNWGIKFSNNGGSGFVTANSGLTNTQVLSLTRNDTNLFAGTNGGGVFISTNNATTWAPSGLTNGVVKTLANKGAIIFAGTNTGVYRSLDNGNSWSLANSGIAGFVKTICFSNSIVFAGTDSGVYYSSDTGNIWSVINTGLTNTKINSLFADSFNIFAGVGGNGVWMRPLTDFGICTPISVSQSFTLCGGQSVTVGSNTYNLSGIFSDTLSSHLGCDSVVTTNLTVNSFPTIPIISGDTSICSGQSETLSVSNPCGGCIYTWSNNLIGQSISVNTASNYSVSATNNCGASSKSDSITVSVNPTPTVTVNSDTICAGQSLMLTANGGTIYSWSLGASPIGVNTAMVSPTTTTTYSVIGTTLGCTDTAYSVVTVNCTVGISDQKDDSFQINPNPSSGQFEITLPTSKAEITITNLLGQQIIKTFVAERTINLEVGTNGIYIIFIKTNQGVTRRKLIVSK